MWADLPLSIIIAHRGDKTHAPENTLTIFRLAAENGADAIEFDLKLTSDGRIVVLLDQSVDRTTNGMGRIYRLSYASVRELDAGAWFSREFQGERIPNLNEVFEMVGKRLHINVELANYATPGEEPVPKVVDLVKKTWFERMDTLFFFFY